jgi:hypothetical protein
MDLQNLLQIDEIVRKAEEAADSQRNGLFDRDEFPLVIRELLGVTRQLLEEFSLARSDADNLAMPDPAGSISIPTSATPTCEFELYAS